MKRVILIVLDSAGIGALPDAASFGDEGANTIANICRRRGFLNIPNMLRLGLAHIEGSGLAADGVAAGCYGKCAEITKAKDTTCGHWEMAGLPLATPFRTYPNGFPEDVMRAFSDATGRGYIGNCVASGTEIILRLGDEHVRTGKPIVYTSADSVFQIAAHESVIPLAELYDMCVKARALLKGEHMVGRVIARPFTGESGAYQRTEHRRDYALAPFEDTILDALVKRGMDVVAIGKIEDIFCHRGVTTVDHTTNNRDGIASTLRFIASGQGSLVFTNLVDFDALYGHRNDVEGYAAALEAFDASLPGMLDLLREEDILIVTADHGCDPTTPGTDHTREYIPLLVTGKPLLQGVDLGVRRSFADIGATAYEYLTGERWHVGESFLRSMLRVH